MSNYYDAIFVIIYVTWDDTNIIGVRDFDN